MVVERHTYESAKRFEEKMHERGMAPVQGQQRRLDILAGAGLPRIAGPRPLPSVGFENAVYTFAEAAAILRHPLLCWHEREAILRRGGSRAALQPMDERRAYWASVLTALALGEQSTRLCYTDDREHDNVWLTENP